MAGEVDTDATQMADSDDHPRDHFDELREHIRSGDLSHSERDQLDKLVFLVAPADRRADQAVRDFPGAVAAQRALSAEARSHVARQLQLMDGDVDCAGRLDGEAPRHGSGRPWS